MGKIAFVFSGQGDQYPGMGKRIYETYPIVKKIYNMCDEIRPNTSVQCFMGTQDELKETRNTQPCMFAMELAAANVLLEKGISPNVVAGFSLGEVVAATISGMFDYETGFRLVCIRGECMQREAEKYDTSMAAVVKLSEKQVEDLCGKYDRMYPVNYNCPGQITVSGLAAEMTDFMAEVKEAGGRAIPLKVKGAFHSPFMHQASDAFSKELEKVTIKERKITLYSNLTSKPYGKEGAKLLSSQISRPVKWEKLIRNMIGEGIDTFIEIGPGKTLTNMIKKINKDVKAVCFEDYLLEIEKC